MSSKRISKKILYLFLVTTTLLQFDSASPMIGEITHRSDPCQKLSTGTKITDLPLDCLHEIFRYLALKSDYKTEWYDTKPMLKLRFVCKEFRQGVKSFPGPLSCTFTCGEKKEPPHNLFESFFQSFRQVFKSAKQMFSGKKNIPLGNVFENVERLALCKYDFKSLKIAWPIKLQTLILNDCKNIDAIQTPKLKHLRELEVNNSTINFNWGNLGNLTSLRKLNLWTSTGPSFVWKNLQKLTNLEELEITTHSSKFDCTVLNPLKGLRQLLMRPLNEKFDWTKLKELDLENLLNLEIQNCHNLSMLKLEKLTNLQELKLSGIRKKLNCKNLKKLKKLKKLQVRPSHNFDENFDENSDTIKKLRENGCEVTIF